MLDKDFERPSTSVFGFGERRGPAVPHPTVADSSWDSGIGELSGESRGSLEDAEGDAAYRWAAGAVKGRHVLDVGCAGGNGTDLLRAAGAATIVGVDRDSAAVEIATRDYAPHGAAFVQGHPGAIPLASGSFEVVACLREFEAARNPEAILAELRRLLTKDGLLLVALPTDAIRDEIDGSELVPPRDIAVWHAMLSESFANVRAWRRRAALAATVVRGEIPADVEGARWLGADPAEDRMALFAASDGPLPPMSPTASLVGTRDLRAYHETIRTWEQRARRAEADGAAKHWELVASREAQRRLRKRLWQFENRPLRRLFRIVRGKPGRLGEGPPIRPPESKQQPWA